MQPDANVQFQAFLDWADRAGWSQGRMAEECIIGRSHLNQVLQGHRNGRQKWKRLVAVLPMEGLFLLKQCSTWNIFAEKALMVRSAKESLTRLGEKCRKLGEVAS